ncbi:hypothetical protein BDN70DRAFT_871876 [Pholiota conissans]|uniref:Uncharacterized protein n=1 Tax=Pholiota conissans TaxID=109636 RepID=A0A9P6CY63_9AGAR|nr:hypothetical protein BDN70DRAFT_871876 [Pholiota conissans]
MAGGHKRTAEDANGKDSNPRESKAAKTGAKHKEAAAAGKGAHKGGAKITKPKLSADQFKAKALPLHVILTHTPPSIIKEGEIDESGNEEKDEDPTVGTKDVGNIGTLTLVPSSFSTGSYGWKGSKRVTVELQAGDSEDGHREKVQVIMSINATVLGSKPEKPGKKGKKSHEKEEEEEEEAEEVDEEAAEEA